MNIRDSSVDLIHYCTICTARDIFRILIEHLLESTNTMLLDATNIVSKTLAKMLIGMHNYDELLKNCISMRTGT
jgi:hypothetical protein